MENLNYEILRKYKEITIVGHVNADVDSVISCILLSKLLDFKKIKNKIKMLDEKKDSSLELLSIRQDYEIGIQPDDFVFLVDSSYNTNNLVGCIDHHPTDTVKLEYNNINLEATSCAKIIYDIMEEENYTITEEIIKMTIFSLFMDSVSFKNTKTILKEKEWAIQMIEKLKLDYDFFYTAGLCLTDLSMPQEELLQVGFKKYHFGPPAKKENLGSSYIQVTKIPPQDFLETSIYTIQNKIKDKYDAWLWLVADLENEILIEYYITEDSYKKTSHNRMASRGKDLIPKYERLWKEYQNSNQVIQFLIENKISISTMESCTSGLLASTITDTESSSKIFKGSFVTYSNDAKTKQGVSKRIIEKYGVYSKETAAAMADACKNQYNSFIGIGTTGTTGNLDPNNQDSNLGIIFYCIEVRNVFTVVEYHLKTEQKTRHEIKKQIVEEIMKELYMNLDNILELDKKEKLYIAKMI